MTDSEIAIWLPVGESRMGNVNPNLASIGPDMAAPGW